MSTHDSHVEHWGPSLGPVVLDIGGEIGAVVVVTSTELEGTEIEIRRPPEPWAGRHVAVRARGAAGVATVAAVFGSLTAGRYELRIRGQSGGGSESVVVRGGDVVWHRFEGGRVSERPSAPLTHKHSEDTEQKHKEMEHSHAG